MKNQTLFRTVHTLTCDVPNPLHPHRDRRRSLCWYEEAILPRGLRLILVRRHASRDEATVDRWRVSLCRDDSREDCEPSYTSCYSGGELHAWTEHPTDTEVRQITYWLEGDVQREGATKKEREHAQAHVDLCRALAGALSDPIEDYRTAFMVPDEWYTINAMRVLHLLYLDGHVTLDAIRQASAVVAAKDKTD
jgi:hypothetical protein